MTDKPLTHAQAKRLYRLHNAAVGALDRYRSAKSPPVAESTYAKYEAAEDAFMAELEKLAPVAVSRESGELTPS